MMTPQEVANCTFAKAVMGGYNMASVDDFLDKLTEDYAALYKENAALKAKLKVLADKMGEYREMEDAMRSTLLTAQKMATNMVSEAEVKRDALIADAAAGAKKRLAEIRDEVAEEELRLEESRRVIGEQIREEQARLAVAQGELRSFIQAVQAICGEELRLLQRLPELPVQPEPAAQAPAAEPAAAAEAAEQVPEEAPPQEEAAPEEKSGENRELDAEVEKNIQDVIDAFAQEAAAQEALPDVEDVPDDLDLDLGLDLMDPFAVDPLPAEDPEATRVLNLDDLQFGRNYKG